MKPYHSTMNLDEVCDSGYIGKYKGTPVYLIKDFPQKTPYAIVVPMLKE